MKWWAPSLRASASFSLPRDKTAVSKPSLMANCKPRWPSPPKPWIATRSPPFATLFCRAPKVVLPAQRSGAASTGSILSGTEFRASMRATMNSA